MTFELKETKYLNNINTNAYVYEHKKTKAKLIFLENDDINKSFSIAFKTIPYNDNGIFHILEHSVLCGSEKYPVKEPFVELLKGSFNTFLNAWTFPDKTMYPVASKNDQDLEILTDIYLDAVFNPKLKTNKNILSQEGWHYHLESVDDKLTYKGVVYNEMKGAYSSVDEVLDDYISQALFTKTPYRYSSGGKPEAIPSITYKEFIDTYNYNYHPSNSYIVLYGNLKIDNYLEKIDNYLNNYEYKDYSNYQISSQNEFSDKVFKRTYFNEKTDNKGYVAYSYILGDSNNGVEIDNIDIIDDILLGSSNTEFRKYFIDNNICEDVYSYLHKDRKEAVYNIIFKYVNDNQLSKLDKLYKDTLSRIITTGFDYEQVQATINKKNFSVKEEINKTASPKGISYAVKIMRAWNYGYDPLDSFDIDKIINNIQKNCDNKCFEKMAKKWLLDNEKSSIVELLPVDKKEKTERDLVSYQKTLSAEEINNIIKETNDLKVWQETPDSEEDLRKIKSVDAKTVKLKNPLEKTEIEIVKDVTYSHFDTITNGISYSRLLFDITDFTIPQLQYSSLLTYLLFNLNTKNKTETEIIKEIDFNLGNISSSIEIFREFESERCSISFIIGAKYLVEKSKKLFDILEETILNFDFENKTSIYNVLLELKLMLENRFKQAGHSFVSKRLISYYTVQGALSEQISEYNFYLFIENLVANFETEFENIKENLENITKLIFNSSRLLVNFVGNKREYKNFKKDVSKLVEKFPKNINDQGGFKVELKDKNYSEGFYFDTLVQYVGVGYNISSYSGAYLVLRHILSLDYLWNNVRVKNGAYGAGMIINNYGNFGLWSYRDPNLEETLEIYYNIYNYIKNLEIDDKTLNKYIIGTLNTLDTLMSPNAKAYYSLTKYLTNSPKDFYKKIVNEVKNTTVSDLRQIAEELENIRFSHKCIIGSKEKIIENKKLFSKIIELN
ncbi:insulinase family protein [Gemella bergeri]